TTAKTSIPDLGSSCFSLVYPQSTTYTTPSTVTLASATLVDTITLRAPRGAGINTAFCSSSGRPAYNGTRCIGSPPGVLLLDCLQNVRTLPCDQLVLVTQSGFLHAR